MRSRADAVYKDASVRGVSLVPQKTPPLLNVFRVMRMVLVKVTAGPCLTRINSVFVSTQTGKLSWQARSCCDIVPQKIGVGWKENIYTVVGRLVKEGKRGGPRRS